MITKENFYLTTDMEIRDFQIEYKLIVRFSKHQKMSGYVKVIANLVL